MAKVRCINCAHFVPCDKNNVVGLGSCQKYEDYRNMLLAQKKYNIAFLLTEAYQKLGSKPFFDADNKKQDRDCPKFERKN